MYISLLKSLLVWVTLINLPANFSTNTSTLWKTSCDTTLWGYYTQYNNTIGLCDTSNEKKVGYLIHELWHRMFFKYFSDKQRQEWNKLSKECDNRICFVSDYAKSNNEEDFAEMFRAIIQNNYIDYWTWYFMDNFPEEIETYSKKIEFVKQWLKWLN